jgi:hypothetical protein
MQSPPSGYTLNYCVCSDPGVSFVYACTTSETVTNNESFLELSFLGFMSALN